MKFGMILAEHLTMAASAICFISQLTWHELALEKRIDHTCDNDHKVNLDLFK